MHKTIEDYPLMLTAEDLVEILMVSKTKVYALMDKEDFPLIRLGRNKRVLKSKFFEWLSKQHENA